MTLVIFMLKDKVFDKEYINNIAVLLKYMESFNLLGNCWCNLVLGRFCFPGQKLKYFKKRKWV